MMMNFAKLFFLLFLATFSDCQNLKEMPPCNSKIYCDGPLLHFIQTAEPKVYKDSKSFVDMSMKDSAANILTAFNKSVHSVTPADFVKTWFEGPGTEFEDWNPTDWKESPKFLTKIKDVQLRQWAKELNGIWRDLGRKMKDDVKNDPERYSLLYSPKPFVVPGGRFREFYYWDSYWTINGLLLSEMTDTVKGMLENFMDMVEKLGFVPNGGRIYFTNRSQPPFLIPMVKSYLDATNDMDFLRQHIVTMEKEYNFWITNRTVKVTVGGSDYHLAHYAVDMGKPRPESYREDLETAKGLSEDAAAELYSNIASAAESGWDFSTRWLTTGNRSLAAMVTRDIIPVDLNSIIYMAETYLAEFYSLLGNSAKSEYYKTLSEKRATAINSVFWDESKGCWFDYDIKLKSRRDQFYVSNVFPLFAGCGKNKAQQVLDYLKSEKVLDYPGGVPTSKIQSGQQWDFPNAWPPLQHVIITALADSGLTEAGEYAKNITQRWILTNWRTYSQKGPGYKHMYEKYDVQVQGLPGRGGEYDVQEGFGWTNGVAMQLLDRYGDSLQADPLVTSHATGGRSGGLTIIMTSALVLCVTILSIL